MSKFLRYGKAAAGLVSAAAAAVIASGDVGVPKWLSVVAVVAGVVAVYQIPYSGDQTEGQ